MFTGHWSLLLFTHRVNIQQYSTTNSPHGAARHRQHKSFCRTQHNNIIIEGRAVELETRALTSPSEMYTARAIGAMIRISRMDRTMHPCERSIALRQTDFTCRPYLVVPNDKHRSGSARGPALLATAALRTGAVLPSLLDGRSAYAVPDTCT